YDKKDPGRGSQRNLSVPARTLRVMSKVQSSQTETAEAIFKDPVAYLASFGIEAKVVAESVLPAAA
ncbi:MAG TPA: hypothetical protein VIG24_19705, partial [Acidimicrobiia bacterium]